MHAFLVRQPELDVFAHLHPVKAGERRFEATLPPLRAGRYKVYADITHENGFTQTLVSEIDVGETTQSEGVVLSDQDDCWMVSTNKAPLGSVRRLRNGYSMRFLDKSVSRLEFSVTDEQGQPALLEPYMDMQAHAVVHSADGTVFTHLHPFGTVSMTSQQLFAKRERENTGKPFEIVCGLPTQPEMIAFPYEFPKAGRYRIWVQVKIKGEILTGEFETFAGGT